MHMSSQLRIRVFSMEPLTPLMFRIPKPFGYGERAESLLYPQPSTLVGMIRSIVWESLNKSFDAQTLLGDSKFTGVIKTDKGQIESTYDFDWRLIGPYLQKIKGKDKGVYYPLPLDVFVHDEDDARKIIIPDKNSMNIVSELFGKGEPIVRIINQRNYLEEFLKERIKKPIGFIHQNDMEKLLNHEYDGSQIDEARIYYLNEIIQTVDEPHLAIDKEKKTVLIREGKGFYFITRKIRLNKEWRFIFGVISLDTSIEKYFNNLDNKISRFGGESGYVKIKEENIQLIEHKQIKKWNEEVPKMLRLVLTSPAVFIKDNKDTWYPTCLKEPEYHTIRITSIGGWDYLTQSPKPLHRGVDMGSVYCYKNIQEFKYGDLIIIRKHIAIEFQGAFGSTLIGIW